MDNLHITKCIFCICDIWGICGPPPPSLMGSVGFVDHYRNMCHCVIVYTWRQIRLSDDFLVTLEHDVTRVVMTSHEY